MLAVQEVALLGQRARGTQAAHTAGVEAAALDVVLLKHQVALDAGGCGHTGSQRHAHAAGHTEAGQVEVEVPAEGALVGPMVIVRHQRHVGAQHTAGQAHRVGEEDRAPCFACNGVSVGTTGEDAVFPAVLGDERRCGIRVVGEGVDGGEVFPPRMAVIAMIGMITRMVM